MLSNDLVASVLGIGTLVPVIDPTVTGLFADWSNYFGIFAEYKIVSVTTFIKPLWNEYSPATFIPGTFHIWNNYESSNTPQYNDVVQVSPQKVIPGGRSTIRHRWRPASAKLLAQDISNTTPRTQKYFGWHKNDGASVNHFGMKCLLESATQAMTYQVRHKVTIWFRGIKQYFDGETAPALLSV